ncbi:MAG: amidase [Promethearchaeota archaeon]
MSTNKLFFQPAWKLAEMIRNQDITAQELTEKIIERIEKINPIINAYCIPTFELAREMAKKADERVQRGEDIPLLNGVPTSIKDLYNIKGIRNTQGSKIYENFISEEDDVVVARLRKAGCVFLGKTNTPEFGYAGVTHNKIFGITRNPWNLERNPGGSSGGAAAAVATGISPLALGSDGGGSLRHPASFCGVFCIKPQFGRVPEYPRSGVRGETVTHLGPLTRDVKDAALMLDVIKGPDDGDRYSLPADNVSYFDHVDERPEHLRIGYSLDMGYAKVLDPEVEKNTIDSVSKFEELGWNVEPVKLKMRNPETGYYIWYTGMYGYDFRSKVKKWRDEMDPNLVRMIEGGKTATAMDIFKALDERRKIYEVFHKFFKEYDILVTPTTAIPAFELGIMYPPKVNGKSISPTGWMPFTFPINFTGHPAASVPSGFTKDGLPTGMQIVGRRFAELTVLQVARAFEELSPWNDKIPPVAANA